MGLDICCGTGMLAIEQARAAGPTGRVIGLDFSKNMIEMAQQNIKDFSFKDNVQFIQGDAMALPFENNCFDCVTVGWGLRNVPDVLRVVQEMARVVKPGGKVISLDMAQPAALFLGNSTGCVSIESFLPWANYYQEIKRPMSIFIIRPVVLCANRNWRIYLPRQVWTKLDI